MTTEQEREANELTSLLRAVALHSNHGARDEVRKPLVKLADQMVKKVDGQTRNELEIARANVAALGK
jgi:hypothetical protein